LKDAPASGRETATRLADKALMARFAAKFKRVFDGTRLSADPSRDVAGADRKEEGFCRSAPVAYPFRGPSPAVAGDSRPQSVNGRGSMPKGRKPTPEELARRLRENLRRRKAQQRARRQGDAGASALPDDGRAAGEPPPSRGPEDALPARDRTQPGGGD